jgi:anti-sigma-K factor RskA
MAYSEDHIALAAEYALGSLDADERAQVETMMAVDQEFAAIVQAWEFRLGVLNQMVGSVEPRPFVWDNIRRAVGHGGEQAPLVLPEAPPPPPPGEASAFDPEPSDNDNQIVAAPVPPAAESTNVIQLNSRVRRWRSIASIASAIAAALLVMVGLQVYQPDALPDGIRPKPRTRVVEVKSPPPPAAAQYVALLQSGAGAPAFILTIDAATKNFTVRKVGAQPEVGKSYELWIVSDRLQRPRSLGVIGKGDFTARPVLSGYDAEIVNQAVYAVSVEPEGGSPTGAPTGPVVFSGKLIETVPPAAPAR